MRSLRQAVLVEHDVELVADLVDVDVGDDVDRVVAAEGAAGPRLEPADHVGRRGDLLDRDAERARDAAEVALLQRVEVLGDDARARADRRCRAASIWSSRHSRRSRAATPADRSSCTARERLLDHAPRGTPACARDLVEARRAGSRRSSRLPMMQLRGDLRSSSLQRESWSCQLRCSASDGAPREGRLERAAGRRPRAPRRARLRIATPRSSASRGRRASSASLASRRLAARVAPGVSGARARSASWLSSARRPRRASSSSLSMRLLEDRVLLQLLLDEVDELEPRELQQLDRLLQLRRHHQLLGQA